MNNLMKLLIAKICTVIALVLALMTLVAMLTDNSSLSWTRSFLPFVTILIVISVVLRRKARKDV